MQLKYIPTIVYNCLRISIDKLLYRNSFSSQMIQLISSKTKIDIQRDGQLLINGLVHTEPNVLLSVKNGKLTLGNNVYINRNTLVVCRERIDIEDGVTIGPNVCIYDHDHDLQQPGLLITKSIHVGKNAWIGAGAIILKGVTIGENAVIASGAIVVKDVPDNSIVKTRLLNDIVEIHR